MSKQQIGVVGMAVMGRNLALNIESRGYTVSVFTSVFSNVLFPEPEVPMIVTNSPSRIVNDTPRRAWTVSSPTWKSRFILSNVIISFMTQTISYFCCFPEGPA